jgi:DNA invertase Pin-like site-specific DNA recombinase
MKRDTFNKSTKRAAIYCRVSTDDQSCDRQERDLLAYAERADYTVVVVEKETASGARNDRKKRAAIMALARTRQIDTVLVTELTRWGRSTLDLLHTLDELASHKVSVISQTGMTFDLSTSQGRLMLTLLAGFSQFERDLISERTKSGLAATRARGTRLGRPTGNRTDAKHRVAVCTMIDAGISYRAIAHKLRISQDTITRISSARQIGI